MKLSLEERVEREKQRRKIANAQMREKVAAARKIGICRCGGKLDIKPGTEKFYSTCKECREKVTVFATRYYREGPLPPKASPSVKLVLRLKNSKDVRRRLERDGLGREAWRWFASAYIDGRQCVRRWAVDKYCDRGARQQAWVQRREWEEAYPDKRRK